MFRRISLITAFLAAFMLPAGITTTVTMYSTDAIAKKKGGGKGHATVSYTHLTLPTNSRV